MDLRKMLLKEHSKRNANKIFQLIENDKKLLKKLMVLFLSKEYQVAQRAAWVVRFVGLTYPEWVQSYAKKMILNLKNPVHDSVKRNTLRILEVIDIPRSSMGELTEKCFEFLQSSKESIAIKVFSMSVLGKIIEQFPELKNEFKIVIEDQLPFASQAFKSRAKKVIAKL